MARVRAYVGLGANVGDARATLAAAVATLAAVPGAHLGGVSRLYRTAPVGVTDQPDFLNAAVALDVRAGADPAADATGLLIRLKALERDAGRRKRRRWGPRELDLDLLLFGWHRISVERPPEAAPATAATDPSAAARLLEVPHPSMRDRLFVLAPLADLAPDLVPPGWTETVDAARRRRLAEEGPGAVRAVGEWDAGRLTWTPEPPRTFEIRAATSGDVEEIARVHTASSQAAYRDIAPPDPGGLERRRAMWAEVLAHPEPSTFVAVADGAIIGLLNVGPARGGSGRGEIRTIYVLQEWWARGAGQALLDRAHEELAHEFGEAELTVLAANARARRFYERNGWELDGLLVEPHFGGIPVEVARYRRVLRRGEG